MGPGQNDLQNAEELIPPKQGWLSSAEIADIFFGQVQTTNGGDDCTSQDAIRTPLLPASTLIAMLQDEDSSVDSETSPLRKIPVVLLVYGGGGGTFATIDEAVRRGHSLIVVPQSGRAAYAIYTWRQTTFSDDSRAAKAQKDALLLKLFNDQELGELARVVRGGRRGMIALLDNIAAFSRLYLS